MNEITLLSAVSHSKLFLFSMGILKDLSVKGISQRNCFNWLVFASFESLTHFYFIFFFLENASENSLQKIFKVENTWFGFCANYVFCTNYFVNWRFRFNWCLIIWFILKIRVILWPVIYFFSFLKTILITKVNCDTSMYLSHPI